MEMLCKMLFRNNAKFNINLFFKYYFLNSVLLKIVNLFRSKRTNIYFFKMWLFFLGECNQADIVFVLDSSGSIGQDNWLRVLNFTKTVVSGLEVGPFDIRVGCVSYGTRSTVHFYLDTHDNKQDILDAIDMIPWKDQVWGCVFFSYFNFIIKSGNHDGQAFLKYDFCYYY